MYLIGLDDEWADTDVIQQVLARSQAEYYESLKKQQEEKKNQESS